MSEWQVEYTEAALDDLKDLDGSQRLLVLKAIKKVSKDKTQGCRNSSRISNRSGQQKCGSLLYLLEMMIRFIEWHKKE